MIIVGGEKDSLETAMTYLNKKTPVLVIDGSGSAADFISKGYRMSIHEKGEGKLVFSETFKLEMMKSAKYLRIENVWKIPPNSYEEVTEKLQKVLNINRKFIYVHSVNNTTYTLDRTIQDILFRKCCEDEKDKEILHNKILDFVDLWDRPDIAEKAIFNLENINNLNRLQTSQYNLGEKYSYLSKLFRNALLNNNVDVVKQVLEYIQDKELYRLFLENFLEDLYKFTGCLAGFLISKQDISKENHIVRKINEAVIKIIGIKDLKPFMEDCTKNRIPEKDIFKHFFIWAVLVDWRDLAMLFWKRADRDYICSALYASALAKKLAENSSSEAYMDKQVALMESSRYYEDLAYSVMTEFYWMDKKQARKLLVTEVERFNYTTIFEITEKFTLMKFMGHAACQTQLNKIWKGRILSDTSNCKAIAAAFIPILIMQIVNIDNTVERTENKFSPSGLLNRLEQEAIPNGLFLQSAVNLTNWMRKIYYFYDSPSIKFIFYVLTYMSMVVIFCLFVLTDLYPMSEKTPSVKEYFVYALAASRLTEEIRKAFVIKRVSLNLMNWFSLWTLLEIVMYSMFTTSVILRFTLSAENFYHARMAYAITLGIFIINSMQFFLVSKYIGPKVIMIGRMMFDIVFFLLIFAVFLFGFGVIYRATMYPNSTPGLQLFREIIYMPYWQLYGELFLDQLEGKDPSKCTNNATLYHNGTMERCPEVNQINTVVLGVYMVITHIILINILIAMLMHTFTKVQDNNELVWKFYRFSLIQEYYNRSALIPPFSIISHMKMIIIFIYHKCTERKNNKFKMKFNTTVSANLAILEEDAVYSYLTLSTRLKRKHAQNMEAEKDRFVAKYESDTDQTLLEQFNLLSSKLDTIQETVSKEMKRTTTTSDTLLFRKDDEQHIQLNAPSDLSGNRNDKNEAEKYWYKERQKEGTTGKQKREYKQIEVLIRPRETIQNTYI
ncbi:transient receptor potential cation channel subfamily M member 2-like [Mytilus californianus]|uniref:transient receptor potential cation channel subfamily M member 2-like n=1 Tax=Mytilus californianus TaxID=6549 RepID=UPI0022455F46|nr:transient receptor potential cation channel subfamily M member 2-like [Mytilus californianus]